MSHNRPSRVALLSHWRIFISRPFSILLNQMCPFKNSKKRKCFYADQEEYILYKLANLSGLKLAKRCIILAMHYMTCRCDLYRKIYIPYQYSLISS